MHPVVDQLGEATCGDALTYSIQVRFICNGILRVREVVSCIRQQLDERDPEVSRVTLHELWVELWKEVQKQPSKAGIILRLVIEQKLLERGRRAHRHGPT